MQVSEDCVEFLQWETKRHGPMSFSLKSSISSPIIVSEPFTERFELVFNSESQIRENESIDFKVRFIPPSKDEEEYLWDNFQDRIMIYSPKGHVQVNLFAYKQEKSPRLYPRRLPKAKAPTQRIFKLIQENKQKNSSIPVASHSERLEHHMTKSDAAQVIRRMRSLQSTRRSTAEDPNLKDLDEFKDIIESVKKDVDVSPEQEEREFYKRFISPKPAIKRHIRSTKQLDLSSDDDESEMNPQEENDLDFDNGLSLSDDEGGQLPRYVE